MSRGGEGEGPSVADRLADEIADAIMVGEYPLGTWLRQGHLAERFGVSRQPVREALRRLEVVGMIEARPRRGLRVKGLEDRRLRVLTGGADELAETALTASASVPSTVIPGQPYASARRVSVSGGVTEEGLMLIASPLFSITTISGSPRPRPL